MRVSRLKHSAVFVVSGLVVCMHRLQVSSQARCVLKYAISPPRPSRRDAVCRAGNTPGEPNLQQQTVDADVQLLEEAYRRPSAPSPDQLGPQGSRAGWQDAGSTQLRSAYNRQVLPVLETVRAAEQRLEANLPSVGNAVIVMVAIIMYDMGWNNILDRLLGDSVLGSVSCILVGLGMVFGVKIFGYQPKDFWKI